MKRRDFIRHMSLGFFVFAPALISCTGQDLGIARALGLIEELKKASGLRSLSRQTPFQIIAHCTQSIDCALKGYPEMKGALFQHTIGKAAFRSFSLMDAMKHDREAPIPGMPLPAADGDLQLALNQFEQSFLQLQAAAAVKPHFFFGELSHQDMQRAQVMHFLNHLELLHWQKS